MKVTAMVGSHTWEKTYIRHYLMYTHDQETAFASAAHARGLADAQRAGAQNPHFGAVQHHTQRPDGTPIFFEELATKQFIATIPLADGGDSAATDGGMLSAFSKLSGDMKEDVQFSCLFAQLAANFQFVKETQPVEWFKVYVSTLEKIGWIVQTFEWKEYVTHDTNFTMDEVVIDLLLAMAVGPEIAVLQRALEGLKTDESKLQKFERNTKSGNNGCFQISTVTPDADDAVMPVVATFFKTTEEHGGFLWWAWASTSIQLTTASQKMVLSTAFYRSIRDDIKKRLGVKTKEFIDDVPLK
jgi:hypothetical protein